MSKSRVNSSMNAIVTIGDTAAHFVGLLQDRELMRGHTKPQARRNVARQIGCTPGTLENIERRRTKNVGFLIVERARNLVIRELEREIARLQHELEVARLCSDRPNSDEVLSAFAALEKARALIRNEAKLPIK